MYEHYIYACSIYVNICMCILCIHVCMCINACVDSYVEPISVCSHFIVYVILSSRHVTSLNSCIRSESSVASIAGKPCEARCAKHDYMHVCVCMYVFMYNYVSIISEIPPKTHTHTHTYTHTVPLCIGAYIIARPHVCKCACSN